jgi:hypothetical protein
VPLPAGYKPEHVAPALARKVQTLPEALRRSLTWDQGPEMRDWKQVHIDAGIDVFFCYPHAPWQRGSNENTNGLLRQYFPKGTDFSTLAEAELDAVADELNDRPRKRLDFANPTEQLTELLLQRPLESADRLTALPNSAGEPPPSHLRELFHVACARQPPCRPDVHVGEPEESSSTALTVREGTQPSDAVTYPQRLRALGSRTAPPAPHRERRHPT